MKKLPDLIFGCKKCSHNLYVSKIKMKKIVDLPEYECPNCGRSGYENWIILGEGNFSKDYPELQ